MKAKTLNAKPRRCPPVSPAPICPHCSQAAVLVDGRAVYPHRPDLADKPIWQCAPCGAHVGCHPGTTQALGTPADAELRRARSLLHGRLDPIWETAIQTGGYSPEDGKARAMIRNAARSRTYAFLADRLCLPVADCHVGMFDLQTCRRAWVALAGVEYPAIRMWAKARPPNEDLNR